MKKISLILSVFMLNFILASCSQSAAKTASSKINSDPPTSAFSLVDTKGETRQLSDYKGEKLVIKFWASWCPSCLAGLAEGEEIASETAKGYQFLTVTAPDYKNEQPEADFISWFDSLELSQLPVLLDPAGEFTKKMAIRGYPSYAYIDTTGQLSQVIPGQVSKAGIEEIVAGLN